MNDYWPNIFKTYTDTDEVTKNNLTKGQLKHSKKRIKQLKKLLNKKWGKRNDNL